MTDRGDILPARTPRLTSGFPLETSQGFVKGTDSTTGLVYNQPFLRLATGFMKHTYHKVDIFIFDIHTAIDPLQVEGSVQKGMEFLVDEELYNKQHRQRLVYETSYFKIRPLTYNSRKYNHFWNNYMSIWQERGVDFWKLQIPFICVPKETKLEVESIDDTVQVTVKPIIYLNALGWSTNLTINLKGSITPTQLRTFIGKLRSKDKDVKVFKLDDKKYSLSEIYIHFTEKIREALYYPPGTKRDIANVHRHIVVSITSYSGPIYYYKSKWQGENRMTDVDQALLHSILHGRPIDIKEFAYLNRSNKYSVIQFNGPDLALSYFDIGTLVFLQKSATRNSNKMAMHCLASNIRSCSMISLLFMYFFSLAKKSDESQTSEAARKRIYDLLSYIKKNIKHLPDKYTNQFCRDLCDNHSDLKKIRTT